MIRKENLAVEEATAAATAEVGLDLTDHDQVVFVVHRVVLDLRALAVRRPKMPKVRVLLGMPLSVRKKSPRNLLGCLRCIQTAMVSYVVLQTTIHENAQTHSFRER